MSNPNLRYAASIYGNTVFYDVTTVAGTVLTNTAASGKILKVNSIFCANTTSTVPADITVAIQRSSVDNYIARSIVVPGASTLMISTKETYLYLLEGDIIRAFGSANSNLVLTVSYEEIG